MLSDWGQSSAAGLFDNVGSLVSHMRRVGRSGKLARRNTTSLIDGKEQKVAGAIYECVMNDDWKASKRWFGQCNNITYFILALCDAYTRECMILHTGCEIFVSVFVVYGVCSGTDANTCVLHNAHLPANAVSRKDGVLLHVHNTYSFAVNHNESSGLFNSRCIFTFLIAIH